jgi:DNA-binding NarL/FixJ family response regulator
LKRDGSRYLDSKHLGLPLTKREQHIRDLTASGLTAGAVAEQLGISYRTVETHRQKVFGKLGVRNAADLVARLKDEEVRALSSRVAELEALVQTLRAEVAALKME